MSFPGGTSGKEPTCQHRRCERLRFNPWVRKIPKEEMATHTGTLAWRNPTATVHGVTKSQTRLKQLSTAHT